MIASMSLPADAPPRPDGARELDRATLLRAKAGDPIAFRAFVVRYQRPVFAILSRLLGPGPHVEDLAQETFLKAFRALPGFDVERSARPSTWLLTIATRLALDAKRRRRIVVELSAEYALADERSPERSASTTELGRAITRAAAELPDDQRAAFLLAEFHGLSIAEIAEALDAPENTVKTRLFRARQRLKQALEAFAEDR
jgi:RNA polymerase sigma-70 factor, ECF subfamily